MTAVSISAGSGALSIRCVMRVTPVLCCACLGQVMHVSCAMVCDCHRIVIIIVIISIYTTLVVATA